MVQTRQVYDRGDGVSILLYNQEKNSVILTRQFRLPTYLNGNPEGYLIEACAGKLDEKDPEKNIIKEVWEETGYRIKDPRKIFEIYMSPGSVTEKIHFYLSPYSPDMKLSSGGENKSEQEDIEVLELAFPDALEMIQTGQIKDAKTIILLQFALINNLLAGK